LAVTAASVKAFAPGFTDVADAIVSQWIAWGAGAVLPTLFQTDADQALTLWVCHNLQLTQGGQGGDVTGPSTGKRVGDVQTSNGATQIDISGLKATAWGLALSALIRRYASMPRVA